MLLIVSEGDSPIVAARKSEQSPGLSYLFDGRRYSSNSQIRTRSPGAAVTSRRNRRAVTGANVAFQSHSKGFDYLKSEEIDEKIVALEFLRPSNGLAQMLLSCNEKTV